MTGECYTDLAAAIASPDCPSTGCSIDMTGSSANQVLGTINAGTKVVKIILGSFQTYTMDHLVCSPGLELWGTGLIGTGAGTKVTSAGLNSQPLIVAPQSNAYSITCNIHDIEFDALPGSTSQEGIFFDFSTLTGATIENSIFENLTFARFGGSGIEIKGRSTDASSAFQFNTMRNITVFQSNPRVSPAFKLTGYSGQNRYETFLLNEPAIGDSIDMAYLGPNGNTGTQGPSGSQLTNWSTQGGSVGIHFGGVVAISTDGGFAEATPTQFSVTPDSLSFGLGSNNGIIIHNWYVAGTAGTTAVLTDADSNSQVTLADNTIFGTPSAFINGPSAANVRYCGNKGPLTSTLGCSLDGPWKLGNSLLFSNVSPTILSGFGTHPSVTDSNGTAAMKINIGTGGMATSGIINLPVAKNGWACHFDDMTTQSATVFVTKQTATSPTTVTIGNFNTAGAAAAWVANDALAGGCMAF